MFLVAPVTQDEAGSGDGWMLAVQRSTDRVQHEAVDSLAGGEHDHSGAAVKCVTSRHKVSAGLQGVFLRGLIICGLSISIVSSFGFKSVNQVKTFFMYYVNSSRLGTFL